MDYWVVVVDDDALSLKNVRSLLNDQGMKVTCLRSGPALLEYMENHDPDLILLDIQMPEMGGFEAFQALRRLEETKARRRTPVIFLTGENTNEAERRGLSAGASDFIHKPFDQEILVSRIRNTISNNRIVESLTEDATMDKLTGFLNKSSGTKRITELCSTQMGALMLFDLDNFKLVNDLYGHDMGDAVLEAFAGIVRHNIRTDDVICRIGGDEFMGFFCDLLGKDAVTGLSKRINEQLAQKCVELMGEDFGIPIGISVGAVFVPEHGNDYHTLFQLADSSLYRVKHNGKHGCEIYDPFTVHEESRNDTGRDMSKVTQLMEERGAAKGAQILGQDAFCANYRLAFRFMKIYGGRVKKILFTLTPDPRINIDISAAAQDFEDFLVASLRQCDIIFRFRHNQFFVLLPAMPGDPDTDEGERIRTLWKERRQDGGFEITYAAETVSFDGQT